MKKFFILTLFLTLFLNTKVNAVEYIYFDLYYGNVTISNGKYSGYTFNGTAQSGTHSDSNNYYIFQSNGEADLTDVPDYARVNYNSSTTWAEYITNHPGKSTNKDLAKSVDDLIAAWGAVTSLNTTNIASTGVAIAAGRKPTPNRIIIKGGGTYNVVIDDIWSSFQTKLSSTQQNQGREDLGGIVYIPTELNTTLNLFIEGDNRFGNIHAATHDGQNGKYTFDTEHTNKTVIRELNEGSDSTLTLCNLMVNQGTNDTAACIGGTDNWDHSTKLIFESGVVYAGSSKADFGTAIGGGGNGDGRIIIKGGKITAIHSSTGTALGGGCGTSGPGGYGSVTIEDGEVYAYSCKVSYGSNTSYNNSLPTAIGGGSSGVQIGGTGIVEITGGTVYAYSEKGNAIGAGGGGTGLNKSSYYSATGGIADITISGGEIIALSGQGCAIGGGPGGGNLYKNYANVSATNLPMDILSKNDAGTLTAKVNANGGEATLKITGGTIKTGSIGGGSPLFESGTDKNIYGFTIGAAKVYISGGTTHGQIVMEGTGSVFEMTNGTIDNSNIGSQYKFVKNDGGAVYVKTGNATLKGGKILNASANNGGAVYVSDGIFKITGGTIQNCTAAQNGGAIYLSGGDFIIEGGNIGKIVNGQKVGCKAIHGGAAYISGGNFTMNGGIIEGNTATESGGAIQISNGNVYITDGKILSNVARGESSTRADDVGYGGGIFVDGGETVRITGGEISNNVAAKNGGGIEVKTDKTVTIDVYSGIFEANVAEECGGAVGVECANGTINVGEENCDGSVSSTHEHPIILDNLAGVQGGGFYMSGSNAKLNIYCGFVDDNKVDSVENNFDQSNGTITVHEGCKIGTQNEGIIIVGGAFDDDRVESEEMFTIRYYSNYEGSTVYTEATITKGALITIPGNIFGIEDYTVIGWTEDQADSTEIEYIAGDTLEVSENITVYALWVLAEENEASFVIVIPAEISFLNYTDTMSFDIDATINLFSRNQMLEVRLEKSNFNLALYIDDKNCDSISYKILKDNKEIKNNEIVLQAYSDSALITYNVKEELEIILEELPKYSGSYKDCLTFVAEVKDLY